MRTSRAALEHQAVVSRRLAQLSADLAVVRPEDGVRAGAAADAMGVAAPDPHPRREVPGPPPVPVPGRHAARRSGLFGVLPGRLIPTRLVDRVALGSAQLTVVAVTVALGLAIACWWLLRSEPRVVAPATVPVPHGLVTPVDAASPTSGSAPIGDQVVVDVAGRVRRPGIAVLGPGSRVIDAIKAAGGVRRGVDLGSLNLARRLVDGEQILVGVSEPAGLASTLPAPAGAGPGVALVNLNTAGQSELESLPEVGPVTAQAIMTWREEHGGFTAVDQLLDVDGIGEATLSQVAPRVTL